MGNIGWVHLHWVGHFWPVILIAIGGWLLSQRWEMISTGSLQGRRALMGPAVLLALGMIFMLDNFGGVRFGGSWPLLLIVIGLVLLWQRSARAVPPPSTFSNGAPPEPPRTDGGTEPGQEG
jgi:hypothetical protein